MFVKLLNDLFRGPTNMLEAGLKLPKAIKAYALPKPNQVFFPRGESRLAKVQVQHA